MKTIRITREQIEKALGEKGYCKHCIEKVCIDHNLISLHTPQSFEIDVEEEEQKINLSNPPCGIVCHEHSENCFAKLPTLPEEIDVNVIYSGNVILKVIELGNKLNQLIRLHK